MILEFVDKLLRDEAEERAKKPNNPFRASSAGRCIRESCFDLLGLPGKPLQPRRMLTMKHGTVIHDELLTPLLKKALGDRFIDPLEIYCNEVVIDGVTISFHVDGGFRHECDCNADFLPEHNLKHYPNCGTLKTGLVEIKSMADYSFERAKKGEIDHDYLCQAWVYHQGTDFNPVVFLGFRKETSHMVEIVFDRVLHEKVVTQTLTGNPIELAKNDPILLTEIRSPFDPSVEEYVRKRISWLKEAYLLKSKSNEEIKNIVPGTEAVEDEIEKVQGKEKAQEAERSYGKPGVAKGSWYTFATGRKILGFPCSYCAHMERCYPDAKMELKGDRPIWVLP